MHGIERGRCIAIRAFTRAHRRLFAIELPPFVRRDAEPRAERKRKYHRDRAEQDLRREERRWDRLLRRAVVAGERMRQRDLHDPAEPNAKRTSDAMDPVGM